MTQGRLLFIVVFLFFKVSVAQAKPICSFDGVWDMAAKKGKISATLSRGGNLIFQGVEKAPFVFDFRIDAKEVKVLLFEITTEIVGAMSLEISSDGQIVLQGSLGENYGTAFSDGLSHAAQGKFEIREGKVLFSKLSWRGLFLNGECSLNAPYQMDLVLSARHVLLSDLFSWMGQDDPLVEGDVSGEVRFLGFSDSLSVKGKLYSSGKIGDFSYDHIAAGFEGFYPIVKLVETSVTQEGGVSFFLEGNIDLSKDFTGFSEQIAKMKILPLIRQTDVDREWTIRRDSEGQKTGETEFKYRLRKEREVSGVSEGGMVTIERSIKF